MSDPSAPGSRPSPPPGPDQPPAPPPGPSGPDRPPEPELAASDPAGPRPEPSPWPAGIDAAAPEQSTDVTVPDGWQSGSLPAPTPPPDAGAEPGKPLVAGPPDSVGPPISGHVFNTAALMALGAGLVGLIILIVILLIAFHH